VQLADAVFVGFEGNPAAVFREIEFADIPLQGSGEHACFMSCEIEVNEALKF
jgi:hypothetical protein